MVFAKASHLNKPDTKDKDKYKLTGRRITSYMANIMPMWQEYINNYSAWHNVFKPNLSLKQNKTKLVFTLSQKETTTIRSNQGFRLKSRILEWYLH